MTFLTFYIVLYEWFLHLGVLFSHFLKCFQKRKEYRRLARGGGIVVDTSDEEDNLWFLKGCDIKLWNVVLSYGLN